MLARVDALAALAADLGVRIMIDAEHSYFQPAIDHIALQLQRRYNSDEKGRALIYNTIQCYLKDAPRKLAKQVDLADREGWHFAVKLVRGASVSRRFFFFFPLSPPPRTGTCTSSASARARAASRTRSTTTSTRRTPASTPR